MANDDYVVSGAVERLERRAGALLESCIRIVERQVGRRRFVTTRLKAPHDRLPARAVMPGAVDQAENGHATVSTTRMARVAPSRCLS